MHSLGKNISARSFFRHLCPGLHEYVQVVTLVAITWAGCSMGVPGVPCPNGLFCPEGYTCLEASGGGYTCCPSAMDCQAGQVCLPIADGGFTCSSCGNGFINPGESCDGTDLGGTNCVDLGMAAGTPLCTVTCELDPSPCTDSCGPPPSQPCGASSITDDFEDGVTDLIWGAAYATGDTAYGEDQGFLMLTLPVNQAGYAAYQTHLAYQLTTYSVSVQIVVFPHDVVADCSLEVKDESTDDVAGMSLSELDLSLFSYVNQTRHTEVTAYFQGNLHRYWRLSATGGLLVAEVSGDGVEWALLGSMLAPFSLDRVQIALKAGSSEAIGETGHMALFDDFNILP